MTTALYEIVMLPCGDFALQRTDETEEPLVKISFSEEAKGYLQSASIDVVKAMIDAGIAALEELGTGETDIVDDELYEEVSQILH